MFVDNFIESDRITRTTTNRFTRLPEDCHHSVVNNFRSRSVSTISRRAEGVRAIFNSNSIEKSRNGQRNHTNALICFNSNRSSSILMTEAKNMTLNLNTTILSITIIICAHLLSCSSQLLQDGHQQPPRHLYKSGLERQSRSSANVRPIYDNNQPITPVNWARAMTPTATISANDDLTDQQANRQSAGANRRSQINGRQQANSNLMKSVRHIVTVPPTSQNQASSLFTSVNSTSSSFEDICADRLCYGLPQGCRLGLNPSSRLATDQLPVINSDSNSDSLESQCNVLVTSKRFIDPNRPIARDILFELIALPVPDMGNYAAVGFSENGRMQGIVSECLQYRDSKTQVQMIKLKHSYNIPGAYSNTPVKILSGIKNLGVSYENGHYQCRWIVESAVEFSYEASNGSIITRREDLGYKNYHILLATGEYNQAIDAKGFHTDRVSSATPVSLAQTGHIRSLGAHILIRIHGSLMIVIWVGLVTISIIMARYYKNEWANSKMNDLVVWFVVHRAFMLTSWFGSIIAVIFAYMYTETYHPALHQISGTMCLILTSVQVAGGLFRPSIESSKRIYFNWTHFICGNLSYLLAMVCLITAAFLPPAHLPPLYIWVIVIFVAVYALIHTIMTTHQYMVHKSSKISITPMNDLHSNSSTTYTSCGFVADSYQEEKNSPFRQLMMGILVTVIVIFIVLLISLVNIN